MIYSNRKTSKASADTFIANSLANQRTNRLSTKDTERKKWLFRNNFLIVPNETIAYFKGYFEGFATGFVNYLPQIALSAFAIGINKNHKVLANVSAIALAGVEVADYITNSLSSGQKNDYLKTK